MKKKKVLFVCIENSCRSQMAEAFAHLLAADVLEASSAGSHPSGRIDPKAIQSMREVGYDLGTHYSKPLDDFTGIEFDFVITMGCGDECPFIPAVHQADWDIQDPKGLPLAEFNQVRDLIRERVEALAEKIRQTDEQ